MWLGSTPLAWQRAIWTKGAFSLIAERPEYDGMITTILAELDADKRATLQHAMAQKLYEQYHGVMLGMKSTTWAFSKKVGTWSTLLSVPLELRRADARDRRELRERAWPSLGDLLERRVVEDNVGRHFVGFRSLEAPLLQRPERGR